MAADRSNEISILTNHSQLYMYFDLRHAYHDCSSLMLVSKIDYAIELL